MVTTAAPSTTPDEPVGSLSDHPVRGAARRSARLRRFTASSATHAPAPAPAPAPAQAPPPAHPPTQTQTPTPGNRVRTASKTAAVVAEPAGETFTPVTPRAAYTVTPADGTRLRVHEYGLAEGPTVVLVHGWTCSVEFWTLQVRALADAARVVAYDQRGHGHSSIPGPAGYTSDALADDLRAVLDACLPDGSRAVVVGHSMGAMTVVAYAGRHPDAITAQIRATVLASTGVCDLVPSAALVGLPPVFNPVFKPLARLVLTAPVPLGRPRPLSHHLIRFLALTPSATTAQVEFCERITLGCRGAVRGRFGAAMAAFNLLDAVPALTVPTAVVVGSADRLTPPLHSYTIAAALPDLMELRELPGVGHMTPIEAADAVTDIIHGALTSTRFTPR